MQALRGLTGKFNAFSLWLRSNVKTFRHNKQANFQYNFSEGFISIALLF
jgi:hypothetical protein